MIRRLKTVFWPVFLITALFGLYKVKYKVLAIQHEIAEINAQLQEERESLHVVAAEWSYLNRPARVQQLSEKFLDLEPIKTQQISRIESLPFPGPILASDNSGSNVKPVVLKPLKRY